MRLESSSKKKHIAFTATEKSDPEIQNSFAPGGANMALRPRGQRGGLPMSPAPLALPPS